MQDRSVRSCDGCTKCCEGWLSADIKGHRMWPGRPCHFAQLGKGCTIYENRPKDPCKDFTCEWLVNEEIPAWMKPSDINALIVKRSVVINGNKVEYYQVSEAGSKLTPEVLNWVFQEMILRHRVNVRYMIDGGYNHVGTVEFVDHFVSK